MALPLDGPISFQNLNTDRGILATAQVDINTAAIAYGIPDTPHGMNEFYSRTGPPVVSGWSAQSSMTFGEYEVTVGIVLSEPVNTTTTFEMLVNLSFVGNQNFSLTVFSGNVSGQNTMVYFDDPGDASPVCLTFFSGDSRVVIPAGFSNCP